jgi:hypothetical protein
MLEKLKRILFKQGGKSKNWGKGTLSFDMFYQLSYMSTIAAAGVPRDQVVLPSSSAPPRNILKELNSLVSD